MYHRSRAPIRRTALPGEPQDEPSMNTKDGEQSREAARPRHGKVGFVAIGSSSAIASAGSGRPFDRLRMDAWRRRWPTP